MHCRSENKLDYRKMGLRCCALLLRISTLNSTLTVKILAMLNEKCTAFTPQKFLCFGWGGGATSTFIIINGSSMLFVEPVSNLYRLADDYSKLCHQGFVAFGGYFDAPISIAASINSHISGFFSIE
uniref:Uncharacterized protein n=1 Tax=Solanum lycopersicum TaxID=4081 RepID=A0A3Q7I3Y0_SOLLC